MTTDAADSRPDPLKSELQTKHPRIAEEIEGAIQTLRKLKEIAGSSVEGVPQAQAQAPATIAITSDLYGSEELGAGRVQDVAQTEAEPSQGEQVPALQGGSTFGRYQVVRILGRGAMGAVYLAYDTELHRHVAIKTPSLGKSRLTIERFYREARAAAQLRSPYLCPIYDVGKVGEVHYLSMAFIDGVPLSKVMARGQLKSPDQIVAVIGKLARGLQKAHEAGIVHRDLKPDNIMVDVDGEPIVLDFGLARRVSEDTQVTLPGTVVGTPAYMSPEQIDGDPTKIGPATDIYSLGIVLYQMLTGKLPFTGSVTAVFQQIATKQPASPSTLNPGIISDSPLEQICLKMVAKSPTSRFPSMADVAAALDSVTPEESRTAVLPRSRMDRLKSWSTGLFSRRGQSAGAQPATPQAPLRSIAEPEAPTLADPP
jgi:serine/threonine protein kinase